MAPVDAYDILVFFVILLWQEHNINQQNYCSETEKTDVPENQHEQSRSKRVPGVLGLSNY